MTVVPSLMSVGGLRTEPFSEQNPSLTSVTSQSVYERLLTAAPEPNRPQTHTSPHFHLNTSSPRTPLS